MRMNPENVAVPMTGVTTETTTMTNKPDLEDVCLWPDGTWCYRFEKYEMNHMGDDYEVLPYGTEKYNEFFKEQLVSE